MKIICCDCNTTYKAIPFVADGVSIPIIECPRCGLQHTIEFTPFRRDVEKKELASLKLGGTFYAILGGSRILSIDGTTDHSAADDADVVDWDVADEFIVAVCIHSGGKETEPSTYKLQVQDDTDTSGYADLAATGELDFTITDSSWAHGATVATGDQVCDIQGGDTRQAGERVKGQSLSDSIDLVDEFQSELWFGINPNDADAAHVYSFQLYSIAEGAAIGVLGVLLTMASAAPQSGTGAESCSVDDAQSAVKVHADSTSESVSIDDAPTSQQESNVAGAESSSIDDAPAAQQESDVIGAESSSISEVQTASQIFNEATTESASITEAQTSAAAQNEATAESASVDDAQSADKVLSGTTEETVSIDDTPTGSHISSAIGSESASIDDTTDGEIEGGELAASIGESVSVNDTPISQQEGNSIGSESASVDDTPLAQSDLNVSTAESSSIDDTTDAALEAGEQDGSTAESLSINDVCDAQLIKYSDVTESVAITAIQDASIQSFISADVISLIGEVVRYSVTGTVRSYEIEGEVMSYSIKGHAK